MAVPAQANPAGNSQHTHVSRPLFPSPRQAERGAGLDGTVTPNAHGSKRMSSPVSSLQIDPSQKGVLTDDVVGKVRISRDDLLLAVRSHHHHRLQMRCRDPGLQSELQSRLRDLPGVALRGVLRQSGNHSM